MPIRIFLPDDIRAGNTVKLMEKQAHYLTHVMRCQIGDPIYLFNSQSGEWCAHITCISKRDLDLRVDRCIRAPEDEGGVAIQLWFAPLRPTANEWLVEKATELGVANLCPIITHRTQNRGFARDRLQRIVIEATEQCGRLSVPEILSPQPLERMLLASEETVMCILVADERRHAPDLGSCLATLPSSQAYALVVGPEGGFSPEELAMFEKLPHAQSFSLGEWILRAETASLAALSIAAAHSFKTQRKSFDA